MKKWIFAFLIALLVVGLVSFTKLTFINFDDDASELEDRLDSSGNTVSGNVVGTNNAGSGTTSGTTSNVITTQQLSTHDKKTDCWIAYSGKVYDLTAFLPRHPGSSAAIEPYCGTEKEFANAFVKQHGTSKVGALLKVGTLIGDFEIVGTTN